MVQMSCLRLLLKAIRNGLLPWACVCVCLFIIAIEYNSFASSHKIITNTNRFICRRSIHWHGWLLRKFIRKYVAATDAAVVPVAIAGATNDEDDILYTVAWPLQKIIAHHQITM